MQKKYKFVIKIKKVLSYPLNQTDTKMSFFQMQHKKSGEPNYQFFKTYSEGWFFGKV